jgi:carbon monoxide dehydrogenase subunit G
MQISDEFQVTLPVEQAWRVLLDVERIAPCMPGAQLQEVEGDEYRGIVKVKVGPITAQYKGAARIVEADEGARRIVIRAEGRDTRGQGNASANVTATLRSEGDATVVGIDTDLQVTGKVAQFGRGVMAEVSSKLLGQFVECLHTTVLVESPASTESPATDAAVSTAAPATTTPDTTAPETTAPDTTASETTAPDTRAPNDAGPTPGVRTINAPEARAVDLGRVAGGAVAKRLVPVLVVGIVVIGVVVWLVSR